jgi:hypothetical protein
MRSTRFCRIKKVLAFLLLLCFTLSVTTATAKALDNGNCSENEYGYKDGYYKGSEDGKIQGKKDCEQYGSKDVLSKIPYSSSEYGWTENYKKNYDCGYKKGYIDSYNQFRYNCLKLLGAISSH